MVRTVRDRTVGTNAAVHCTTGMCRTANSPLYPASLAPRIFAVPNHMTPMQDTATLAGLNFELSEEQIAVRDAARDFAQNVLKPGVIERDRDQKFPAAEIKQLGELGFLGMMVDPKYGGGGMDTISYVLAMEEISKVDASTSVVMSVNNSLVCWGLEQFGNEEQKQKYLVPLAKGEVIGAFCLSEPEAGSDATSQRTTAIDMGDHYLLNGTKNWITNGGTASTWLR